MATGSQHATQKRRVSNAIKILKRLEREVLNAPKDKPLTNAQMRAAEIVLRKAIPDLKATEYKLDKATIEAFCIVRNGADPKKPTD